MMNQLAVTKDMAWSKSYNIQWDLEKTVMIHLKAIVESDSKDNNGVMN